MDLQLKKLPYMLIDAVQSVGRFIKIAEVKMHDKNNLVG